MARTAARPDGTPSDAAAHLLGLQREAGNAATVDLIQRANDPAAPSPVHEVLRSGRGVPLDQSTRRLMEGRFGCGFGDVRIHADSRAAESARSVQAQAYTSGTNIVFGRGHYQPQTRAGRRMLAHELTHVLQQKAGPVAGTPRAGGIQLSSPSDRFEREAERTADAVVEDLPG